MTTSAKPVMAERYAKALDVQLNVISMDAPWEWLAAGWRDLWARPGLSLGYGAIFAGVSALLFAALVYFDLEAIILPLAAGFLLIGPLFAIGLYEISRRIQDGLPLESKEILLMRAESPAQLLFLGVVLTIIFLAWIRIATLMFALFFGLSGFPPLSEVVSILLFSASGLTFMAISTAIGGLIAFLIFAMSATSVPILMRRDADAITAVLISIESVRRNFWPMVLWAWLIVILIGVGIATLFVGLIVTFPLVGHATWHAYRDLLRDQS
jgi:uncharacterized membrane protein